MWDQIDAEIVDAARPIVGAGKYDDAIFAAFRLVEDKIQSRICSKQIGEALIAEAFDGAPPRINISSDSRDQRGILNLYSGALANIRNDRGHKKAPLLPCTTVSGCFLYLGFASFLLYLLTKDKNIFPRVESLRVVGTDREQRAELRGANLTGAVVSVIASDVELAIVRLTPKAIEAILPPNFHGDITVVVDGNSSKSVFCDASALTEQPEAFYEVIAAEVALFEDAQARIKRKDVVGLLLRANEGSMAFHRIVPTRPGKYRAGCYVLHGPWEAGTGVGETWYVDPVTSNIESAWVGSLVSNPEVLCSSGDFKLGALIVQPAAIRTSPAENRCLRVTARGRDGKVLREMDVTDRVTWQSTDPSVTWVKNGAVVAKKLGRASAECHFEGFAASADISIEQIPKGQITTYFQGLRHMQQIGFDSRDNLYVCNQSNIVFCIGADGSFTEVVRIPGSPLAVVGIDCLTLDQHDNLYVNDVSRPAAFMFKWDGKKYVNPVEIGKSTPGSKKGFAISSTGDVYVALLASTDEGAIVCRDASGKETSFVVPGMPWVLAIDNEDRIYTAIPSSKKILVYRKGGQRMADAIYEGTDEFNVSAMCLAKDGSLYLSLYTGQVMRLTHGRSGFEFEVIASGLGTLSGISIDSHGRVCVSDLVGNVIKMMH